MTIHHHPFIPPTPTGAGTRPRIRRLVSFAAVAAAAAALVACGADDEPVASAAVAADDSGAVSASEEPSAPEAEEPEVDLDGPLPTEFHGTMTVPGYYLSHATRMSLDAQLHESDGEVLGTLEITVADGQDMGGTPMTTTGPVAVSGTRSGGRLRLELGDFADRGDCQYTGIVVELVTTDAVRWNQDTVDGAVTCPDGEVEDPILRSFRLVAG